MTSKTIKRRHPAVRDDIADLTTRRPVPGAEIEQVDPFLFLNHHGPQVYAPRNRGLPFGPHPHRGFETVTFILTGELAHLDSAGHESIIREGGIQWMTAGSGLVHAEVSPDEFKRQGGPLEILQLWVNLPPRLKMTTPRYVGLQRDEIPAIATPDGKGTVHLTSGEYLGKHGAMGMLCLRRRISAAHAARLNLGKAGASEDIRIGLATTLIVAAEQLPVARDHAGIAGAEQR